MRLRPILVLRQRRSRPIPAVASPLEVSLAGR